MSDKIALTDLRRDCAEVASRLRFLHPESTSLVDSLDELIRELDQTISKLGF